jgi:hypothetical protein
LCVSQSFNSAHRTGSATNSNAEPNFRESYRADGKTIKWLPGDEDSPSDRGLMLLRAHANDIAYSYDGTCNRVS